jgi:hypothetical protein
VEYLNENGVVIYTTANNFDTFYAANDKRPGRYTYSRGSWAFED